MSKRQKGEHVICLSQSEPAMSKKGGTMTQTEQRERQEKY